MGEGGSWLRVLSSASIQITHEYLSRAAALAERGIGLTAPNPPVGCVIVRDDHIVGEGFHPRVGEPHAEVSALAKAGKAARGADVYVTLEPCRHHGRTPPCTEALIAAEVASVTIGAVDPSADAGGGADALRAAGVRVAFAEDVAEDPEPFTTLVEGWLSRVMHARPFVTVKAGLSLDARVALASGLRSDMTGLAGAKATCDLRSRADAILVSAATVAVDDPMLTVRDESGGSTHHQPLRVVYTRSVAPPFTSQVFTDPVAPTLVLAGDDESGESIASAVPTGIFVSRYDAGRGLLGALEALGAHGVNELLIEAGPRLTGAFWEADLIDQLVTITAGGMAGDHAPPLFVGSEGATAGSGAAAGPDAAANASVGKATGSDEDADAGSGGNALTSRNALERRFAPVEAGIVEDVSVVAWRRKESKGCSQV